MTASRMSNMFRSQFTNKFGISNMTIMNERLFSFGVSFALPKNSPYTAKYDPGMAPRALYYS